MEVTQLSRNDAITESTWQELIGEIQSDGINVTVDGGNVALNGTVDSFFKKMIIERLVSQITGVKSITNQIDVQPDKTNKKQDEEIKDLITGYLKKVASQSKNRSKIQLESKFLTIEGELENITGNEVIIRGHICTLDKGNHLSSPLTKYLADEQEKNKKEVAYWEIFN